jgi:hypothetical protein
LWIKSRDANAERKLVRGIHLLIQQLQGRFEPVENGFAAVLCSLLSEDHEFVAAIRAIMSESRNVLLRASAQQTRKSVALKVPERVIDALELVNVYKKKKKGIAGAAGQLKILQAKDEEATAVV